MSVVSGELLADWVSPVQTGYQTDVGAVRFDAGYACAAFWGDDGNIPTMVVLDAKAGPVANPILSYTSPGSMYACEVVRDAAASNATHDVVFASFSGKHTPANNGGCGGDAYAFRLDVDVRAHASSR